jgi:hypothetical protein
MSQMKHDAAEEQDQSKNRDGASEQIVSAAHPVENAVMGAASRVRDATGRFVATVQETGEHVGRTARDSFAMGRTWARQRETGFEGAVRARPLVSLLVAGAVGLLAAELWKLGRSAAAKR